MSDAPIRLLFLCTGNSARSQIAEALLQRKGAGRFIAGSAGTYPSGEVHPDAVNALARMGVDWSDKQPKSVDSVIDQNWEMVITVCDRAKETCPLFPGRPSFAHWGVPDPAAIEDPEERERAFANTVAVMSLRLDLMLAIRQEELRTLVAELLLQQIGTVVPSDSPAVS